MQLTRFTDYSLRVLIYLATRPERLGRIDEIAAAYGVSQGHLMKVVRGLSAHGFIESVRGRGGGIQLARPAEDIGLGEVVRKTEENLAIVECFAANGNCVIAPACGLQDALRRALTAFLDVLDEFSLADLAAKPRKLARLLELR